MRLYFEKICKQERVFLYNTF